MAKKGPAKKRKRRRRRGGLARLLRPLSVLLAAVAVALGYSALERTVENSLTHVPLLPMYPILFLDFFASGCYTWWKKRKRRGGR